MDNEAPEEFKQAIRENKCTVELTPADLHHRYAIKRAIQAFKSHFIGVLAGVADDFLIHQWDELVPQTIWTINLLRQLNVAPNICTYPYHHGQFNYNRMPLAPMSCAIQFHIKPTRQKSWGEWASDGWYLHTLPEHYRCHVVFLRMGVRYSLFQTLIFDATNDDTGRSYLWKHTRT